MGHRNTKAVPSLVVKKYEEFLVVLSEKLNEPELKIRAQFLHGLWQKSETVTTERGSELNKQMLAFFQHRIGDLTEISQQQIKKAERAIYPRLSSILSKKYWQHNGDE